MRRLIAILLLCPLLLLLQGQVNQGSKSVSLVTFGAKTDGSAETYSAWNAAIASGANHIDIPPGQYLLAGAGTVALSNIEIECHGSPAQYNNVAGGGGIAYGTSGATIQLTSTSVQPFTVAGGVRIIGCNFFWPNQTGVNPTPTAYPPLFTEPSGKQLVSFECISCRIINAYDFMDQGSTANTDAFGDIKLVDTMGYAIRYWFQLANVTEFVTIAGFHADAGIYQGVANVGPNYYLINWTAANGAFLHVFGNGNGTTTTSTVNVGGFVFCCGIFGYNKLVWVDSTGSMSEAKFFAVYDAIPHVLQVDAGGCVVDTEFDGLYYSYQVVAPGFGAGGADNAPMISVGAPVGACTDNGLRFTGHLFSAQGDVLDISGANIKGVALSISGAGGFGHTSSAGTYYFANVNGANLVLDAFANHVESFVNGATRLGFNLQNCYQCTLTGNSFNGIYNPIILGSSTVPVSGAGNIAVGSPVGGLPVVGTGDFAHRLLGSQNTWDKYANPSVSACGSTPSGSIGNAVSTDLSGVISVGGGAVTSCTLTFANAWTTGARCYIGGMPAAAQPSIVTSGTSSVAITSTATMNGATLTYHCDAGW